MRLYLINPSNPLVTITKVKESRWNRYRVWKPLNLMVLERKRGVNEREGQRKRGVNSLQLTKLIMNKKIGRKGLSR